MIAGAAARDEDVEGRAEDCCAAEAEVVVDDVEEVVVVAEVEATEFVDVGLESEVELVLELELALLASDLAANAEVACATSEL